MSVLLFFLILPKFQTPITLNPIPAVKSSNSSIWQESGYNFIWDEFVDAPGDIPGDDILQFGSSFGVFHNYTEITAKINNLENNFPDYCEVFSIGKSHLNHEIYGIKLTDETITKSKDEVLIVAQHHARELITVENALYYMDRLIHDAINQDSNALNTLATREIYIIPSLNVDGTLLLSINPWQRKTTNGMNLPKDQFTFPNLEVEDINKNGYIDLFINKTEMDNEGSYIYEGIDLNNDTEVGDTIKKGVDPNRNYDYGFGNSKMASDIPESFAYSGQQAFSEKCTTHLKNFIDEHKFKTAISLHSGIEAIYYPYIIMSEGKEDFDYLNYYEATKSLKFLLGFDSSAMRANAGLFAPWMYWEHKESRLAYCLETYGNESALKVEFNKSTNQYTEYGVWDFFNPPANQVINKSSLVYGGLNFLVNFENPEPASNAPIIILSIGCGTSILLVIIIRISRKKKLKT